MTDDADHASCRATDDGLLASGLSESGRALAVAGFAAVWENRAVRPEDLVPNLASAAREAAHTLADRGRCELDEVGRLIGIHGLTLHTTRHHFEHEARARHTWCALDAIGIPAALAIDAVARTDCPACHRPLDVVMETGLPGGRDQVLWLPGAADNLIADFCDHADLYCSVEHLERRIDPTATAGEVIDVTAAASLGRDIWADVAKFSSDISAGRR